MPTAGELVSCARSHAERGTSWGVGYCLKFSRTCAGAPAGVPDATAAWRQARHRHSAGTPPRGALVFWTGGSRGHGHVAISDGAGYVWSTDIRRAGKVDRVSLGYLAAKWPSLRYAGWAEDVNGVRVAGVSLAASALMAAPATAVHLGNLRPGSRHSDVATLQRALRRHGMGSLNPSGVTGYFGAETRAMVAAFQRKQGWDAGDADGTPGPRTCALLGLHVA